MPMRVNEPRIVRLQGMAPALRWPIPYRVLSDPEHPHSFAALKDVDAQQRPAGLWQSKSAIKAGDQLNLGTGRAIRDTEDVDGWRGSSAR